MKTNVIVCGAYGKLGKVACRALEESNSFELVAKVGRHDSLEDAIKKTKPSIVIEVSNIHSVFENSKRIIEHGVYPVIGASGLNPNDVVHLKKMCEEKNIGGIIAPNFALGAVLMMQFAKIASKYLPNVEIIETHHPQKIDAPSGTALKTAEMIAAAKQQSEPTADINTPKARGEIYNNIPIHSLRLPGFIASQKVIFGNLGENLIIENNCIDRQAFASGIILASEKVLTLDSLEYGLETILFPEN